MCLEMALICSLGFEKNPSKLKDRLPFLRGSLLGEEEAFLTTDRSCRLFPKLVKKITTDGVTPLNNLSDEDRKKRIEKLKEFFNKNENQDLQCHIDDWSFLIDKLLEPNVLYILVDKSASGDIFYFTQKKNSLHFKFKTDKVGGLTTNKIVTEAKKLLPILKDKDELKLTLVFVDLNVDQEDIKSNIPHYKESDSLFLRLPPETIIKEAKSKSQEDFMIPHNMDIIILLEAGLQKFITPHNIALLKKGSENIEDYFRLS
jgi:hypothetical protein